MELHVPQPSTLCTYTPCRTHPSIPGTTDPLSGALSLQCCPYMFHMNEFKCPLCWVCSIQWCDPRFIICKMRAKFNDGKQFRTKGSSSPSLVAQWGPSALQSRVGPYLLHCGTQITQKLFSSDHHLCKRETHTHTHRRASPRSLPLA